MKTLLILLLSLINFEQNYASSVAQFDDRIINGTDADISQFPFIVYFSIKRDFFACAGNIVDNEYIITAAHCAELCLVNLCDCSVLVGATKYSSGTKYNVAAVKVHEKYNFGTNDYDGAVLKLCTPLVYGRSVAPISFASPTSKEMPANKSCIIVGWGVTETGATSDTLKYAIVKIVDVVSCNKSYPGEITDRMICAADEGKDTCNGDSGGPLICDSILIGITSWGEGCAQPGYPGVYTKVKALSQWFIDTIAQMKLDNGPYLSCFTCI